MSRVQESNLRRSRLSPPEEIARDVEDSVMDYVAGHAPASRRPHSRTAMVSAAALAAAVIVLVFTGRIEEPRVEWKNEDFTESRIVISGHVSIWLTPIDESTPPREVLP